MCLEMGRIDGNRFVVRCFGRETRHDPREHAHIAPPFPAVAERFRGLRGPTGATVPFNCAAHIRAARHASASRCD